MLSVSETPITGTRRARACSSSIAVRQPREAARLEERIGVCGAKRLRAGGGEERSGPTVQDRLGGGDRDDQVRVDQSGVDAKRHAAHLAEIHEVGVLGVVHLDDSVKPPGELRRDELLELALAGASGQPSSDEEGLSLERDTGATELIHGRGDRRAPWIIRRPRDGEGRWFDDDRRPSASRNERLQRRAGERKAQRVTDRGGDVCDRFDRRTWRQHDPVLARIDDCHARAGEDWDSH